MSTVRVAKQDSPLEKAIQKIESILEENHIQLDVGMVHHGDNTYDLTSMCGAGTGVLPRLCDDEKLVLRD